MKFWISLCVLFFVAPLQGDDSYVLVRGGGYGPSSKGLREMYSNWWPFVGVEWVYRICPVNVGLFVDVDYTRREGHFSNGVSTKIDLVPMYAGVRYDYWFTPCWEGYLGVGATYYYMHLRNVYDNVEKGGFGSFVRLGTVWSLYESLLADASIEYVVVRVHNHRYSITESRHSFNFNGLKLSFGLGWQF